MFDSKVWNRTKQNKTKAAYQIDWIFVITKLITIMIIITPIITIIDCTRYKILM